MPSAVSRTGGWTSRERICRVATRPRRSWPGTTGIPIIVTTGLIYPRGELAVVGVGNVAMDVTRVLVRDVEDLASTDIAEYALEALRRSSVEEVVVLGRRGPVQAKFTPKEIREIGDLPDVDLMVSPQDLELDPFTRSQLEKRGFVPDRISST